MVEDALAGKIDLIITKSISRFARNTVDTLTTVRKLKEKGIEVFFEKKDFYTGESAEECGKTGILRHCLVFRWCLNSFNDILSN